MNKAITFAITQGESQEQTLPVILFTVQFESSHIRTSIGSILITFQETSSKSLTFRYRLVDDSVPSERLSPTQILHSIHFV